MSKCHQYAVKFTAIVTGWAHYEIADGENIRDHIDGSSDIEWDFSSVRDVEMHDAEYQHTFDSEDCWGDCDVEDASNLETRAPYPLVDAETEEVAPDNDDGFPF
jgi:hypothetical protein